MSRVRLRHLGAFALLASALPALPGATLAHYNFTSGSLNSAAAPVEGVTASAFNLGANGTASSGTGTAFYKSVNVPADQAAALDSGNLNFFSFTVAIDAGSALDLDQFQFSTQFHGPTGTSASTSKTATFLVQSSIGGFGESAPVLYTFTETFAGPTPTGPVARSFALSALQDITGTVEFRIYLYSNSTSTSDEWLRIDNVTLSGEASAIPEPATTAGVAGTLGLAVCLVFRRRRAPASAR